MIYPQYLIDRFWKKVDKQFQCKCHNWEDRCWVWTGCLGISGYGSFHISKEYRKGKSHHIDVHVFILEVEMNHYIIRPAQANHDRGCLLKHCVRHLYLGTASDNGYDASVAGVLGKNKGNKNGRVKLTENQVMEMRILYNTGQYSYQSLANFYGVSYRTIYDAIHYVNWTHIK